MHRTINVSIRDKIAVAEKDALYICGNSDFVIAFDFDDEWAGYEYKTARFVFNDTFADVVFSGNECAVPVLSNTYNFIVGVFAGDLHTTTPAYVAAKKSILCGTNPPAEPTPDVYRQMVDLFNAGLVESKANADAAAESKAQSDKNASVAESYASRVKAAAEMAEKCAETAVEKGGAAEDSARAAKASADAAAASATHASSSERHAYDCAETARQAVSDVAEAVREVALHAESAALSATNANASKEAAEQARQGAEEAVGSCVSYFEQDKTDEEKAQARKNIGAAKTWDDLDGKPFSEEIVEDIIIPLDDYCFNSSTSSGAQKAYQFIDDTGTYYREFKSGTLCSVLWQGKVYECVYERSYYGNEGFIGNKSILSSSMEDTGEPFVINFYKDLNRMEIRTNSFLEDRTYTIKAYIPKMTITPLHGATSLILLSPGGKRFKITVSDNGTLSTAEVTE